MKVVLRKVRKTDFFKCYFDANYPIDLIRKELGDHKLYFIEFTTSLSPVFPICVIATKNWFYRNRGIYDK